MVDLCHSYCMQTFTRGYWLLKNMDIPRIPMWYEVLSQIPSGNQTWLAGKPPNWMEVLVGKSPISMIHFPASHVWLPENRRRIEKGRLCRNPMIFFRNRWSEHGNSDVWQEPRFRRNSMGLSGSGCEAKYSQLQSGQPPVSRTDFRCQVEVNMFNVRKFNKARPLNKYSS